MRVGLWVGEMVVQLVEKLAVLRVVQMVVN